MADDPGSYRRSFLAEHGRRQAESNQDVLRDANRLARAVLEGQARNYVMMRALLHLLALVLVATLGLFVVLLVQMLR